MTAIQVPDLNVQKTRGRFTVFPISVGKQQMPVEERLSIFHGKIVAMENQMESLALIAAIINGCSFLGKVLEDTSLQRTWKKTTVSTNRHKYKEPMNVR